MSWLDAFTEVVLGMLHGHSDFCAASFSLPGNVLDKSMTDNDLSVKDGTGNQPQGVRFRFMRNVWPGTLSLDSNPSAREDSSDAV